MDRMINPSMFVAGMRHAVLATLLMPILLLCSADAVEVSDLTGNWYTEAKDTTAIGDKRATLRRELLQNRADGSKTNTFRYYGDEGMLAEVVVTYQWGVNDDFFWTECKTRTINGATTECSERIEYDLISVTRRELKYKSLASGVTYSARRVANNYRLP
jgi:hypothetical protein